MNTPGDGRSPGAAHPGATTDQTEGLPATLSAAEYTAVHSAVDLGTHAIGYARAGLEVFPLNPGGKTTLVKLAPHSHLDATSDVDQVRDWWVQAPDANIGIRPAVGIVVVDVDPRDGGATKLAALVAQHGHLAPTWTAWTGAVGLHAWYRAPGPYRGKLCLGLDLKSHSGYVVAPPSLHASGRRYEWANELPIAVAPRWLAELMVAPPIPLRSVHAGMVSGAGDDGLVAFVAASQSGERSDRLYWAAMRAGERGTLAAVGARLHADALAVGLTEHEAALTIASAATRTGVAV